MKRYRVKWFKDATKVVIIHSESVMAKNHSDALAVASLQWPEYNRCWATVQALEA